MVELKPCPFCGSKVTLMNLFTPMPMFYCNNHKDCGAIVSFDNAACNMERGIAQKTICWNRRADA